MKNRYYNCELRDPKTNTDLKIGEVKKRVSDARLKDLGTLTDGRYNYNLFFEDGFLFGINTNQNLARVYGRDQGVEYVQENLDKLKEKTKILFH